MNVPISHKAGHDKANIVFPETVAGFPRGQIHTYDPEGRDMSVGYDMADASNPIAITVYVYPGPRLVSIGSPANVIVIARKRHTDNHFEEVKQEILERRPSPSLVSDQETAIQFRGQPLYGRSATFK